MKRRVYRTSTKLLLLFLPLVLLPAFLTAYFTFYELNGVLQETAYLANRLQSMREKTALSGSRGSTLVMDHAKKNFGFIAQQIVHNLELKLSVLEQASHMTVTNPGVINFLTHPQERSQRAARDVSPFFQTLIDAYGLYEVSLLSIDGKELLRIADSYVPEGGSSLLHAEPMSNARKNEGETSWFQERKALVSSDVLVTSFLSEDFPDGPVPVLSLSVPILISSGHYSPEFGDLEGYLQFAITYEELAGDLTATQAGKGGNIFLSDKRGRVLYHPDKSRLGQRVDKVRDELETEYLTVLPARDGAFLVYATVSQEHIGKAAAVVRGVTDTFDELLASTEVLTFSLEDHFRNIKNELTILYVTAIGFAVLCAYWFAARLTAPLRRMANAAAAIARGELDTAIPRSNGTSSEVVTLAENLTAMAKSLREKIENLDSLVEERTSELLEAKNEAELANAYKSSFLANMSHEIRTPLNAIIGMADILRETGLTEDQQDCVTTLHEAGDFLLYLLNDTLDLAKIEAGRFELEQMVFSLGELMVGTRKMLRGKAESKGLELEVTIAFDMHDRYIGDPARIQQVLVNLIGNSIKFTSVGGVYVSVGPAPESTQCSTSLSSGESCVIRICVRDTGIGVSKEMQADIFEIFTQADVSTTREYGGTGLGLSICRKIVSLMGGTLQLESELGRGSMFYADIPLVIAGSMEEVEEPVCLDRTDGNFQSVSGETSPADIQVRNILIIEDNVQNRKLYSHFIRTEPVEVETAENGLVGFQKYTAGQYDLVVLDLQMPVMDGFDTLKKIRDWEKVCGHKRVPIIVLSAHAFAEVRERCVRDGADYFLTKPVRKVEFVESIKKFSGLSASGLESATESVSQKAYLESEDPVILEMQPMFLEYLHYELLKLEQKLWFKDFKSVEVIAHQIKGSGGSYGMSFISERGRAMEQAARDADLNVLHEELYVLKEQLASFAKEQVVNHGNTG